MTYITKELISLPKRDRFAHKGNFGRVLLICGSRKYTGAAYFAAQSAVNSGSGLVFLSVPRCIRPTLASKLNEPILVPRSTEDKGFDAVLFGCGAGLTRKTEALAKKLMTSSSSPLVLDADAITAIAKAKIPLASAKRELILTPHEGEFARLVPEFTHERRLEFAENFAKANRCTLVLKGKDTVISSKDGELYINTTGNPGMAKGGSGDVLAGIITSLLGQGISPLRASYTAVWLHGAAGDLAAESFGEYAMTPSDMLTSLKSVIKGVEASV